MTAKQCLSDELEYLKEKLLFFEAIKYQAMIYDFEKRIIKVQNKLLSLPKPKLKR